MYSGKGSTKQAGPILDLSVSCSSSLLTLELGTQPDWVLELVVLGHLSQEQSALSHLPTI